MVRLLCGNSPDWEGVIGGVSSADKLDLCFSCPGCQWRKGQEIVTEQNMIFKPLSHHLFGGLHQSFRNLTCSPFIKIIHLGCISSAVFILFLW